MTPEEAIQQIDAEAEFWTNFADAQGSALQEKLQQVEALLEQIQAALEGLPAALNAVLQGTEGVMSGALASFTDAAAEIALNLAETSEDILTDASEAAEGEIDEMMDFVDGGFLEPLTELYESNLAEVCEKVAALCEDVEGELVEFEKLTIDQADELVEKLDEVGEQWKEAVASLTEEYDTMTDSIASLGEDVRDLTDAIDLALQGTGTGLRAATDSIEDIKSVMAGIV